MQERAIRPSELLYDAVAFGMRLYVGSAFRTVVLGREHLRIRPRMIVASTHRDDADVPLICSLLFFGDWMLFRHHLRPHYAARDDLWEPGVLAGLLPPSTPLPLRRLLFRFDPRPFLRLVRAHPLRIAAEAQAVQALRQVDPEATIGDVLPATLASLFRQRGVRTAREALRPEHADLLWSDVDRHELPLAHALWRQRAHGASADLRRLIDVVRSGEALLIFPEGQPSPDGAIGPLLGGLDVLARRGRASAVLPIGIAYDALTCGKPRICVDVGEPLLLPRPDVEAAVLDELRRRTPLTCGQVVAGRLLAAVEAGDPELAPSELDDALADAVDDARSQRRGVDPPLLETYARRRRLSDCARSLLRRGLASAPDGRRLVLDGDRIGSDALLRRAAVEYASAREGRETTTTAGG